MFKNFTPEAVGISGQQTEIIELALSHHFRGISLDIVDFSDRVKASDAARARRLVDSAKLRVGYFALPALAWEAEDGDFVAALEKVTFWGQMAQAAGCTRAVSLIEPASDLRPYHANFELHRKRAAQVADALRPSDVRLGLGFRAEPALRAGKSFEFIHDFEALLVLVQMLASAGVGIALDLWQLVVGGGKIEDLQKLTPGQVVALFVSDASSPAPEAPDALPHRLLPGTSGVIDAAAALTTLAKLDFDGPVTPVAERDQIDARSRDQVAKLAGSSLEQVWKAAGLSPTGKLSTAPAG